MPATLKIVIFRAIETALANIARNKAGRVMRGRMRKGETLVVEKLGRLDVSVDGCPQAANPI